MKTVKLDGLVLLAISLLVPTMASGRGGNPSSSIGGSGRTSGQGATAVEQATEGSGATVQQEIKALHEQLTEAFLKSDTAFLEKYLADDYLAVYAAGTIFTKAQVIENFKSGATKYESIVERESRIRIYGDTAIVTWLYSAKGTANGRPFNGDFRNIRVWAKQNGAWKLVAFQNTAVASPSH